MSLLAVWRHGGVWAGGEGFGAADHLEYMAWVREAGEHGLVSNRFDVASDSGVFLQPMWLVSGLLWRAGASVQVAFLLWKPVVVAVLGWGYVAYVRRTVAGAGRRAVALVLGLFFLAPLTALVHAFGLGSDAMREWMGLFTYELAPAMYAWGYFPAALAAGLTPLFLLALERGVAPRAAVGPGAGGSRRALLGAAGAGLVVAWVHPWQGIVLGLLLAVAALWVRRRDALLRLAVPALALALPLAYYAILSRSDDDWELADAGSGQAHYWRWIALVAGPLVLAALAGWWSRRREVELDLQEVLLRAWPFAIVAVYAALDRAFFYNALEGLALPLAILASRFAVGRGETGGEGLTPPQTRSPSGVLAATAGASPPRGEGLTPGRGVVVGLVALAVLPGAAYELDKLHDASVDRGIAYRLRDGEAAALAAIGRSPRPGPVLTRFYLGNVVPAQTGRRTYVGHPIWSPDLVERQALAEDLLAGRLAPARARALVRETHAAFVLSDCRRRADLRPVLGPTVERVRRFGCATVYEVAGS